MLEVLFGTQARELTLQYLLTFKEGYAREIAKYFDMSLPSIQNQLKNFEEGGLALSKMHGRTKIYFLNPRYAFLEELTALLNKAKEYYKPELKNKFDLKSVQEWSEKEKSLEKFKIFKDALIKN